MQIFPNDKFIEIFAQRFHYFEDPFYKYFALNFAFSRYKLQSCIKIFKFFSFAFYILIFGLKSVKFAQIFRIFLRIFTLEGTLDPTVKRYSSC